MANNLTDSELAALAHIRGLHDTMIMLDIPRPRIYKLFVYWRPL